MRLNPLSGSGTVLVERYRLEERLSGPDPLRGSLWRAVDVMAGDLPVAIRQLETWNPRSGCRAGVATDADLSHPQSPRCGELVELDGCVMACARLAGRHRLRRCCCVKGGSARMRFCCCCARCCRCLGVLHGRGLVHGDLNARHLLRRSSDGLPVLLEGGGVSAGGRPDGCPLARSP